MIAHIFLALSIQAGLFAILRSWSAGAAVACAWAISREITQAEYRWIEQFGHGRRVNMPWWGGLDPKVWQNADPWLDWIIPCAVVIAVAMLAGKRWRGTPSP